MGRPGDKAVLWLAQGFGVGRIPWAPGTFGSILGLGWVALTLAPRSPVVFILLNLAAIAVSVWSAGQAERILGKPDPGSVVIDFRIDDVDEAVARLERAGIRPESVRRERWGSTIQVADPDGHRIQLYAAPRGRARQ